MSNLDWVGRSIPEIEYPRLRIYLIYPHQLVGLLSGEAKITNFPNGAKVYKIVQYRPDDCDNTIAVWLSHPSFEPIPYGNLVAIEHFYWEDLKQKIDITKLPIVETKEYWPPTCKEVEDYYFNK